MKYIRKFMENLDSDMNKEIFRSVDFLSDLFVEIADKFQLSDIEYSPLADEYPRSDYGIWGISKPKGWKHIRMVILLNDDNKDINIDFDKELNIYIENIQKIGYKVHISTNKFKRNVDGMYLNNKFYDLDIAPNSGIQDWDMMLTK